jgi:hypothetical protein
MPRSYLTILGLRAWQVETSPGPRSGWRRLARGFGALALFACLPIQAQTACPSPEALMGAWSEAGSANQVRFEPDRVILWEKDHLRVATILRKEPCKLIVRDQGVRATWTLRGTGPAPELDQGKGAVRLECLSGIPPSLDINPLPLPPPGPVPADKVKETAAELVQREGRDQAAVTKDKEKRPALLDDNLRYLREVVTRYGWIDIPRFGKPAAAAAILIVKHSSNLPLLQDALPVVERDAKEHGGGKELVSILVDDLLLDLGHKQKYGTQITDDEHGKPSVLPVEDLGKVEENRKALGILPWKDYLKEASEVLYGGQAIPGPEELWLIVDLPDCAFQLRA